MMIVLRPGAVRGKNDGDIHYISSAELRGFYKIPKTVKTEIFNPRQAYPEGTIFLYPLYEGNYEEVAKELNLWKVE
jgi:hypothetical protein